STFFRLSTDNATSVSVLFLASQMSLSGMNVLKNFSANSITKLSLSIIMHVEFSSVNWGLNLNPSFVKNSFVFFRSFTARLTKTCLVILTRLGNLYHCYRRDVCRMLNIFLSVY